MTRDEAINELEILKESYWDDDGYGHETKQYDDTMLALDMAIKALEQEPTTKIEESNFSQEQYKADLQCAYDCGKSVIDKIRAEIEEIQTYDGIYIDRAYVLEIIDKHRAESEDKK